MKILLIGNGFDLKHGLPTTYGDFLAFCENVRRLYIADPGEASAEYKQKCLDKWNTDEYIKKQFLMAFECRTQKDNQTNQEQISIQDDRFAELHKLINKNTWLDYFLVRQKQNSLTGENWIDFESEISSVIQSLDLVEQCHKEGASTQAIQIIGKREHERLRQLVRVCKGSEQNVFLSEEAMQGFCTHLQSELDKLIRALEIYIAGFVENIPLSERSPDIEKLKPDHILSFNYSNTYERLYGTGKDIQYNYIHGKANLQSNVRTCNLVLGIDEYLSEDRKNRDLSFLAFKKFYQRIYKSTGNDYLDWVMEIQQEAHGIDCKRAMCENRAADTFGDSGQRMINWAALSTLKKPRHDLYIFGHSLDVTDRDIIKRLICNDTVRTKIYYYRKDKDDKQELGKLIKNLIAIIGQDELIRKTGGKHKTIEFIPQSL